MEPDQPNPDVKKSEPPSEYCGAEHQPEQYAADKLEQCVDKRVVPPRGIPFVHGDDCLPVLSMPVLGDHCAHVGLRLRRQALSHGVPEGVAGGAGRHGRHCCRK